MNKIFLFLFFVKFVKPQSKCLAGSWGASGSTVCTGCAAGFYSTVAGATSSAQLNCLSCPNGLYSAVGSSACWGCVPLGASVLSSTFSPRVSTSVPGFYVHRFGDDSLTYDSVTFSQNVIADVLLIGGGGGSSKGGGGAGAVIFGPGYLFRAGLTYTFTVGGGGNTGGGQVATNGGDTFISVGGSQIFLAKGGGAGGEYSCAGVGIGKSGGSGGGGGSFNGGCTSSVGGTAVTTNSIFGFTPNTRGTSGGRGFGSASTAQRNSGGGGGVTAVGGSPGSTSTQPGYGGNGDYNNVIQGSNIEYTLLFGFLYTEVAELESDGFYWVGGGGTGGAWGTLAGFVGGKGGGGTGIRGSTTDVGFTNGRDFCGGGGGAGGGSRETAGLGGKGMILLRYSACQSCSSGKFLVTAGGTICSDCASGKFSGFAQSICQNCPSFSSSIPGSNMCNGLQNYFGKYTTVATYTATTNSISITFPTQAWNSQWGINQVMYLTVAGTYSYTEVYGWPSQTISGVNNYRQDISFVACTGTCTGGQPHCLTETTKTCCSAGYSFRDGIDSACQSCVTGTYALNGAETSCVDCEAGKYGSAATQSTCTFCTAGKYSSGTGITTSSTCLSCDAGTYSSGTGVTTPTTCVSCNAGSYSSGTGITTSSACLTCSAGKYSSGTGITTSSTCLSCNAGKYSSGTGITTSSACFSCSAGTYSLAGYSVCLFCSAGQYFSGTGVSSCLSCGAGKFSSGTGITTSTACNTCGVGTYSAAGASVCTPCTNQPLNSYYIGYSTANNCPWACNSGYYLNSSCLSCPPNFWCSGNVLNSCPTNSMSNALSTVQNDCKCSPGYFGDGSVTGTSPCPICTAGNWCPGGNLNTSNACPTNFTSDTGSSSVSDCFCLPGYQMLNSLCVLCPSNTFCLSGILNNCPNNSFSPSGSSLLSSCTCNDGFFKNMDQCEMCPVNFYCSLNNKTQCVENAVSPVQSINSSACYCRRGYSGINNKPCEICPSDTWCWTGVVNNCPQNSSSPPMSNYWYNCTCNQGFTGENGQACAPCTEGTYKDVPGSSVCLPCPLGMICPQASINPIPCPLGCFCDGISFHQCPPDNYCPPNSELPTKCPENSNSKNMSTNLSDCKANNGFYSLPPIQCEIDYFCQNSTYFPCSTCDQVTLQSCDRRGLSQDITVCGCESGYYNPENCERCPPHTTTPQNNTNTSIKSCRCIEGYFCTYSKRIFCSVVINTPLSQFDAEEFKASVAFAANVTVDKVFIISITSHVRSLKLNLPTIRVTMFIEAQHISFDKLREHRENKFKISEFKWEQQDFIQTNLQ